MFFPSTTQTFLMTAESNFETFCTQPCNHSRLVFRSGAANCNRQSISRRRIRNCRTFARRSRPTITSSTSMPTAARRVSTRRWCGVKPVRTISRCTRRLFRRSARRLTSHATRWGNTSFGRRQKNGRQPTRHSRPLTITRDSVEISRSCHQTTTTT